MKVVQGKIEKGEFQCSLNSEHQFFLRPWASAITKNVTFYTSSVARKVRCKQCKLCSCVQSWKGDNSVRASGPSTLQNNWRPSFVKILNNNFLEFDPDDFRKALLLKERSFWFIGYKSVEYARSRFCRALSLGLLLIDVFSTAPTSTQTSLLPVEAPSIFQLRSSRFYSATSFLRAGFFFSSCSVSSILFERKKTSHFFARWWYKRKYHRRCFGDASLVVKLNKRKCTKNNVNRPDLEIASCGRYFTTLKKLVFIITRTGTWRVFTRCGKRKHSNITFPPLV